MDQRLTWLATTSLSVPAKKLDNGSGLCGCCTPCPFWKWDQIPSVSAPQWVHVKHLAGQFPNEKTQSTYFYPFLRKCETPCGARWCKWLVLHVFCWRFHCPADEGPLRALQHTATQPTSYFMLFHVIPCYSMLFHVVPCCSMLFHVVPCCSMLFHVVPCCSMLFHVVPCCSMLFHVVPCCSMLFHVVPCCSMLFHVVPCCSMLFHVVPCCSMLFHVILIPMVYDNVFIMLIMLYSNVIPTFINPPWASCPGGSWPWSSFRPRITIFTTSWASPRASAVAPRGRNGFRRFSCWGMPWRSGMASWMRFCTMPPWMPCKKPASGNMPCVCWRKCEHFPCQAL